MAPTDPPFVREFADRCFGRAFAYPGHVLALIHLAQPELARGIEATSVRMLPSVAIDTAWRKRIIDQWCAATWRNEQDAPARELEFVIEHMSHARARYVVRFAHVAVERWYASFVARRVRRSSQVLPMLVYTGVRRWRRPQAWLSPRDSGDRGILASLEPHLPMLVVDLHRIPREVLVEHGAFGRMLAAWQARHDARSTFVAVLNDAVQATVALPASEERQTLMDCLVAIPFHILKRDDARAVAHSLGSLPHVQEYDHMVQTYAEELIEKGLEKGIAAMQRSLLSQVALRFGDVPASVEALICETHDLVRLESWLTRVLEASSFQDLGLA